MRTISLLLALGFLIGCMDPVDVSRLEGPFTRSFLTYEADSRMQVLISEELSIRVFPDMHCEGVLRQTLQSVLDPEASVHSKAYSLHCDVLEADPLSLNAELALSLVNEAGEEVLTYRMELLADGRLKIESIESSTKAVIQVPDEFAFFIPRSRDTAMDSRESEVGRRQAAKLLADAAPPEVNPSTGDAEVATPLGCRRIEFDLPQSLARIQSLQNGPGETSSTFPRFVSSLVPAAFLKGSGGELPFTGLPEIDFLDPGAISAMGGLLLQSVHANTAIALPCEFSAQLNLRHSVRVPRTRLDLTPSIWGDEQEVWTVEFEEDSQVHFNAEITGDVLPYLDGANELRWKLAEKAQVRARGDYDYYRFQDERINMNAPKAIRTTVRGIGNFRQSLSLDELTSSAVFTRGGTLELKLKVPPIEMQLERVEEDLIEQIRVRTERNPWLFFPMAYTRLAWPDQSMTFPHESEIDRGVRATLKSEAEVPASWQTSFEMQFRFLESSEGN